MLEGGGAGPSSMRSWLASYPPRLPDEFRPCFSDMHAAWICAVSQRPKNEAIRYYGGSLDFATTDRLAAGLAGWMRSAGVRAGDRVALLLQNVPHFPIATLAAWRIGAIPVPCNPMYRRSELAALFADFEPRLVICEPSQANETEASLRDAGPMDAGIMTADPRDFATSPGELVPTSAGSAHPDLLDAARGPIADRDEDGLLRDVALILYTSGTTGRPKGATISHASLAFNAELSAYWMEVDADARILAAAPFFHITGFVLHMSMAIAARCAMGLVYRFQPQAVAELVRAWRPTTTIAAVTAFNALASQSDLTPKDMGSLRSVFSGGAPIAPALRDRLRRDLGVELLPVYGMTETCAPTHIAPIGLDVPVDPTTGALAAGLPVSSTDMRIVDPSGVDVPVGEPGEVWVRGPQIMRGYWNNAEETHRALVDGWMRTGDVGVVDASGWLYLVDRQKDMINASGFKVWPRQVEDVLVEHPSVSEAAVVGEPDDYRGETVVAYVTPAIGSAVDEAALAAHCRERLAAYKVPRRIVVLAELPKTETGKIRRAALRNR